MHGGGFVRGADRDHLGGVRHGVFAVYCRVAERKGERAVGELVYKEGAVFGGGGGDRLAVGILVADGCARKPLAVASVEHVARKFPLGIVVALGFRDRARGERERHEQG